MDDRSILSPGSRLLLKREGSPGADSWYIKDFVGSGGACICYSAEAMGKSGRLKEYHPLSPEGKAFFSRGEDGVLRADEETMESLCAEFRRAYALLEETKRSDSGARILNNFIPPYELLEGEGGSLYVWTPDDKEGISFEEYLRSIRQEADKNPERKLYNIIRALITLCDCLRLIHRSGLLHLDLKPSNFLLLFDGGGEINPSAISLFDVNTLYPLGSSLCRAAGTPGFAAPELSRGMAENRSDIYSLGACLFRALIFSEDGEAMSYESADYAALDTLLASSPLIRASETNSKVFLRHCLARVLKKCLAPRSARRYGCCEELMAELERAETFLLPQVAGEKLGQEKRLAVLDAETPEGCFPAAVMRDLLFRCHIADSLSEGEEEIRVLILGSGSYAHKFADICLQACQLPGKRLSLSLLSHEPETDMEIYLLPRPALGRFAELAPDAPPKYSCGRLSFEKFPAEPDAESSEALLRHFGRALPHLIFVTLGDDSQNRATAEALANAMERRGKACGVHYAVQAEAGFEREKAAPLYLRRPLRSGDVDPRLEKWAFNAHLCWLGGEGADLANARRLYRKKYNAESSLDFALSIPAKLKSLGISPDDPNAPEKFAAALASAGGEARLGALAAMEHRRWLLEKVCEGWDCERDYPRAIARGSMKSSRRKLHPCIVPGDETQPLNTFTPEQWDSPGPWDEGLDELDKVSLALHRCCLKAAKALDEEALRSELVLLRRTVMRAYMGECPAFEAYRSCVLGILRGEKDHALAFPGRESALAASLGSADPLLREEIRSRMQRLKRSIFPALESCLRRNYKESDAALIRSIPFILSYEPPRKAEYEPDFAAAEESETLGYCPHPVDTRGISLPEGLEELSEKLAANVHELWAAERIAEGWVYGDEKDQGKKISPCLLPYSQLPESEKDYDRRSAIETLKLIIKLGYRIEK